MPDLSVSGYTTHYEDHDFSPPWEKSEIVVVQHGFARNLNFWTHWVPKIANTHRFIRRDLRGHGGSSDAAKIPWSFDRLVDDLFEFCDKLGLEKIHLIGESTGGMLSTGFAHRFPGRLKSLTLCNSPTTIGPEGQAFFAGNHGSWQEAIEELGSKGWVEWLAAQPGTSAFRSEAERQWALRQMARTSAGAMIGYSHVISSVDVAPLLPEIDVPTLILAPTRSVAVSLDTQRSMAAALPNGQLSIIDSLGHEVYWDRADDCVESWRNHVRSVA